MPKITYKPERQGYGHVLYIEEKAYNVPDIVRDYGIMAKHMAERLAAHHKADFIIT